METGSTGRLCAWQAGKQPQEDIGMYHANGSGQQMAMTKERLINSGFYDLATAYQSVHVNY